MKKSLLLIVLLLSLISCQGQTEGPADTDHLRTYQRLTDSATAAHQRGDKDTALRFHRQALAHARRHGLQEHEARTLVHIAGLLKGENAQASLQYLNSALTIAERLHKPDLRANIYLAMHGIYKQQQRYEDALNALEAHQRLLQQVFQKTRAQEKARLLAAEARERERAVLLTIAIALAAIAGVFAFYYRRTKQLNEALRRSNQIKDTLFSIIGHDLRGPAGGIMQALEMVDAGLLDEAEEKEVIGLLKQQSRAFNETLNTLLNWAAAQLKGAQPVIAAIDAMATIKSSLDLLHAQALAKDIRIQTPETGELSVLADRDQLDFVVRNLLSNAIKFSYPGGEIAISAQQRNNEALITVKDQGKGIPADKQAALLSDGQLGSTYGTKGEKGTGLGLMLSWDFVRANHGRNLVRQPGRQRYDLFCQPAFGLMVMSNRPATLATRSALSNGLWITRSAP